MKRLLACENLVEAQHYANLLRAAGIHAEVRNTFLSGALGDIPFLEAAPQVWVDDGQDMAAARGIIAAAGTSPQASAWLCSACGEHVEGQFTHCWRCGVERPVQEGR